jgi:hypothetical protein
MSLVALILSLSGGTTGTSGGGGGGGTVTKLSGLGDSIMAGAGSSPFTTMIAEAAAILGVPFTVHGHSGYQTPDIIPFVSSEIIPDAPSHCVLEGGVNDIANNHPEYTVPSFTSMIDDLLAAEIVPILLLTLPWTNGDATHNQEIDTNNASLISLVSSTYPGQVIVCDARSTICQFRSGGDVGNLWDVKPAYNADGTHLTTAGYQALGAFIAGLL